MVIRLEANQNTGGVQMIYASQNTFGLHQLDIFNNSSLINLIKMRVRTPVQEWVMTETVNKGEFSRPISTRSSWRLEQLSTLKSSCGYLKSSSQAIPITI